MITSDHVVN